MRGARLGRKDRRGERWRGMERGEGERGERKGEGGMKEVESEGKVDKWVLGWWQWEHRVRRNIVEKRGEKEKLCYMYTYPHEGSSPL